MNLLAVVINSKTKQEEVHANQTRKYNKAYRVEEDYGIKQTAFNGKGLAVINLKRK
jgi:hypothetical protein